MSNVVLYDCETDGFDYTEMHCIAVYVVGGTLRGPILFTDMSNFKAWAKVNTDNDTLWVAHKSCGFDFWSVNELTDVTITRQQNVDTSVLSKLKNYKKFQTHSLREMGEALGVHKDEYTGGFDMYTPEMGGYCLQDVEVLIAIWRYVKSTYYDYRQASDTEHETALICAEMQRNGFKFNTTKAAYLLSEVLTEMGDLEKTMADEWPAQLVVDREIQWRVTKEGVPFAPCTKAMDSAPKWERSGDKLVLYKYKEFNPGSSKDRVDKLWEAGWKPYDRTLGHIKWERERKKQWR